MRHLTNHRLAPRNSQTNATWGRSSTPASRINPGAGHDTFRIRTANGYSADGTLTTGDITIH